MNINGIASTYEATATAMRQAAGVKTAKGESSEKSESGKKTAGAGGTELTAEQQNEVKKLKAADQSVRAHEQAHIAVGGRYVRGAATYSYQTGPDGRRYAVGGEVSIDVSSDKDPAATIRKMEAVRAAAMAPADPSGQDFAVAAQASQAEAEASMELAQQRRDETQGGSDKKTAGETAPGGGGQAATASKAYSSIQDLAPQTAGNGSSAGASLHYTA